MERAGGDEPGRDPRGAGGLVRTRPGATRRHTLQLLLAALAGPGAPGRGQAQQILPLAPVVPGYALHFPRDFGAHPQFGIEWWYVTGWLGAAGPMPLGFQITFFRTRPALQEDNPSAFAARELLIAHCALSDPQHGRLWQDQRIRRAGFGLAQAESGDTKVWIDDWRLERQGEHYRAELAALDFALELELLPTQPPLLQGSAGFSQKDAAADSASYYYSEPHLQVRGRIARNGQQQSVSGEAWLDHEWSSTYLTPKARGWDWIGLNLDDGGAVMAFRIRGQDDSSLWAGGSVQSGDGAVQTLRPEEVQFTPGRLWQSARTGTRYPVSWLVRAGARRLELEPLLDDQENDARLTSGAIYWEGAVRAHEAGHEVGRGYLELTGYAQPLALP
jgi:predicted secreted hydrolase